MNGKLPAPCEPCGATGLDRGIVCGSNAKVPQGPYRPYPWATGGVAELIDCSGPAYTEWYGLILELTFSHSNSYGDWEPGPGSVVSQEISRAGETMRRLFLICGIALAFAGLPQQARAQSRWTTYVDPAGTRVQYPAHIFSRESGQPEIGTGIRLAPQMVARSCRCTLCPTAADNRLRVISTRI
jgi:hypothetical protein